MKRKFSKILGVGLTIALLASLLLAAAPVSALSAPAVTIATGNTTIGLVNADYSLSFVLGKQLVGGSTFSLPDDTDAITITDATGGDSGVITVTAGTVNLTVTGTGTLNGVATPITVIGPGQATWGTPAGAGTIVVTVAAASGPVTGSFTQGTGTATVATTTDVDEVATVAAGVFTLPDGTATAGDSITITGTTGLAENGVITITSGAATVTVTGTATYTVGTGAWTAPAAGDTVVVTATAHGTAGTWTNVLAGAVATVGAVVNGAVVIAAGGNSITVGFPVGTVISAPTATIAASQGWINGAWGGPVGMAAPTANFTFSAASRTITYTLPSGDAIGQAATVLISITAGIKNPVTPGDYQLTVKTSKETTAVPSASYTITAPTILPLPGVVTRRNSAGLLMEQTNIIQSAINNAANGDVIEVGAGTYDEDLVIAKSITLVGDAATTIIKDTNNNQTGGMVTISFNKTALLAGAVFDGFTVMGDLGGANALSITGIGVTVQNCVFTKAGTATSAVSQTMVIVNPAAAATIYGNTITDCTFDTTLGAKTDTAIDVQAANGENTTISNSTFSLDGSDTAIAIADGSATKPVKVTDVTISGASGNGVVVTAGVASITDSTLSNLKRALSVTVGRVTVTGSTIDTCGLAATTTVAAQAAIIVNSTAGLSITSSTISNSPNEIIEVTANSNLVNMMFNNLTDNAKGIDNNDTVANTLNATHNWWGVDTGPATGFNAAASTTTGLINATAYLGGEATGTFTNTVGAVSLLKKTTVGVDVIPNAALGAGDIIAVANYVANPQDATKYPALDGGFYDVYATFTTAAPTSILIKFYNANITANTSIYVWGTLAGGWQAVTAAAQGVNLFEGFAYATVTGTTTPSITGLAGTPFALVETPLATLAAPALTAPTLGATDASLSPSFSWGLVTGATGYEFQLADNANFVLPVVNLTGGEAALIVPFYKYMGELDYATTYYWRAKALDVEFVKFVVSNTSAWATSVFTTEEEVVEVVEPEPEPRMWTCPQCGLTYSTRAKLEAHAGWAHKPAEPPVIEPIVEVITPPATPITPAWIYVIIGVGAVLVIAVIVLIVRTRRVA